MFPPSEAARLYNAVIDSSTPFTLNSFKKLLYGSDEAGSASSSLSILNNAGLIIPGASSYDFVIATGTFSVAR